MKLRIYDHGQNFDIIRNWVTEERAHALWCANLIPYPLERDRFGKFLAEIAERFGDTPFVAVDDEEMAAGFFCYSLNRETKEGILKFVVVDPAKRGKGLGREMITLAVKMAFQDPEARAVQLNVFPENIGAKKCYEGAGFKERRTDLNAFPYKEESWGRCNMVILPEEGNAAGILI